MKEFNLEKELTTSSCSDLFIETVRKEGWVNLYKNTISGEVYSWYQIFSSEDAAKQGRNKKLKYVATIKIEW